MNTLLLLFVIWITSACSAVHSADDVTSSDVADMIDNEVVVQSLDETETTTENDFLEEVDNAKQPIEEAITYIGSKHCKEMKKIAGVEYEQMQGDKEPDLNQLTLQFISRSYNISYNITTAAQLIPEAFNYDPRQNLIIFIHGFTDDPGQATFGNISTALFSQGQYNVLALDGSSLIYGFYLRSTTYVRFMGEKLGEVLAAMVQSGVESTKIHVIGHSLGAHIAGFTGKRFRLLTGQAVGRITGLDPAGPCFSHVEPDLRLKATDAAFVDVIHTDDGVYGLKDTVGHVDFFPNGGSQQPGCFLQTCSHSRAWVYYSESVVTPRAFPALQCRDWDAFQKGRCQGVSYMGHSTPADTRGLYFLQTNEEPPFGRGQDGLVYRSGKEEELTQTWGQWFWSAVYKWTGLEWIVTQLTKKSGRVEGDSYVLKRCVL